VYERSLGRWIVRHKAIERGTNSEREQLMRMKIPLAFKDNRHTVKVDKWRDNLAKVKSFIDTEG
jgi:hypothetical protein